MAPPEPVDLWAGRKKAAKVGALGPARLGAHVRRHSDVARPGVYRGDQAWGLDAGIGKPRCPTRHCPGGVVRLAADEGEAGPPGTSCVRGKMAAPGPCSQELKMEDAAARRSGAGESPTQRKRALPLAGRCFL